MRWPWTKLETRQDSGYSDAIIAAILAAAGGEVTAGLSAGVETAAGHWGRAFASADIHPAGMVADMLIPHLSLIGRSLVEKGEIVFEIGMGDRVELIPAASATIEGGAAPSTWTYVVTLSGPSESVTRRLPANRVLHLMYATTVGTPWRGVSPIVKSGTTTTLLNNLETRLGQETGAAVGHIIAVPNTSASSQLQADIRAMKGSTVLAETTKQNWGTGGPPTNYVDYRPERIGAHPPEVLRDLRRDVEQSVLAACGVPVSVLGGSDGTAARESFRQFLHLTIFPIAQQIARQTGDVFDIPEMAFSFDKLFASDLQGRARAAASLVTAGAPVDRAMALAGLLEPE